MGISVWQLLIILAVVLVIFGAGKLPGAMRDVGKGMRNLKEGLQGDDENEKIESNPEKK